LFNGNIQRLGDLLLSTDPRLMQAALGLRDPRGVNADLLRQLL
jgi:hypothetical protein